MPSRAALLILALVCFPAELAAGDRSKNRDKDTPGNSTAPDFQRVEQLLGTLKSDRKEDRRAKSAEELGTLASPEFPEIVPALIDALVRDESASVRKVVVRSLAAIEPPTHEVKDALEQAVKQDKSWSVRQVARLAAWRYKPKDEAPVIPAPRIRATSKPGNGGAVTRSRVAPPKARQPSDPLKDSKPLSSPVPAVPAPEAPIPPPIAPGPGLWGDSSAPSAPGPRK